MRINIRDIRSGSYQADPQGRDESRWMHATVRLDTTGAEPTLMVLVSPYPERPDAWAPWATFLAMREDVAVTEQTRRNRRERAKLIRALMHGLAVTRPLPSWAEVKVETSCDLCRRPLGSHVQTRFYAQHGLLTLGPECHQRLTGERAARMAGKRAAIEGFEAKMLMRRMGKV